MKKTNRIEWLIEPEEQDYPAANSYLSLIFNEVKVKQYLDKLKNANVIQYKAKDIFRASELSLLGVSNKHIKKDIKKIQKGISLSPLLLVRDTSNGKVIIADGYHRLCAVYSFDEDALIPCKIV
ncbi:MAG: hypothetical protein NTW25_10820 [Candidatus Kapabacteria bacterium]|nr:hypothetical protein [Candidatus Kapabacteria bacterium]